MRRVLRDEYSRLASRKEPAPKDSLFVVVVIQDLLQKVVVVHVLIGDVTKIYANTEIIVVRVQKGNVTMWTIRMTNIRATVRMVAG